MKRSFTNCPKDRCAPRNWGGWSGDSWERF